MKILGIETSCDETAVCIIEADGGLDNPHFSVLGNALYSQVKIHAEYGGVFPNLAKREHAKNLVPLLEKVLRDAAMFHLTPSLSITGEGVDSSPSPAKEKGLGNEVFAKIQKILEREPGLFESLKPLLEKVEKPDIDLIAVTVGPGLEPALWVGINFALALGEIWNIPVMPTNHMEGHIFSPLLNQQFSAQGRPALGWPALALLISGGHTELVLVENWTKYKVIGQTRDDAVGEAFDKVARLLGLPYPGGPQISKLAAQARSSAPSLEKEGAAVPAGRRGGGISLPRPMLTSPDLDFSFSGIKTAVLYTLRRVGSVTDSIKLHIAREFEDAVTEVLIEKTKKALNMYGVRTLILGGGVIANNYIRESFKALISEYPGTALLIPDVELSTDNAVMIAAAAYFDYLSGKQPQKHIKAEGNLVL